MPDLSTEAPVTGTRFPRVAKLLSLFGILISGGTRHPVQLTRVFMWWVAALFVALLVGTAGLYEYSTYPGFCRSCHIMEPYYAAWAGSKHFNRASCVDCHYPPPTTYGEHLWHKFQASAQVVKYVTRTYSSKPFADVPDASCLRSGCHANRLLEGRLYTQKRVKFDHAPHLKEMRRGRQLRCVSCHSQVVVGRHIEVTYETCILCHFRETGEGQARKPSVECLGCHELPTRSFPLGTMTFNHKDFVTERGISCQNCHSRVTQGDGQARQERCFNCHNQPEKLARFGDIPFLHDNHVTKHHVACFHCHDNMRHGSLSASEGPSSTRGAATTSPPSLRAPSHEASVGAECSSCHVDTHVGTRGMYAGAAPSLGLPAMPSPMFQARVDCVGCHYRTDEPGVDGARFTGTTSVPSEEACVKCHGPTFKGIWEETKQELSQGLDALGAKLKAAQTALASLPPRGATTGPDVAATLARATLLQQFVHGAHGEHNIYMASEAMRQEDALLSAAAQALCTDLPDLSSQPLISGSYCATMCHARVGVKVPPETVTVKSSGKTMPHQKHTMFKGCATCHALGMHKAVPLKEGVERAVCATCHPK